MGGATVALRAVHLLRMLGLHKFEMYGFDSCIMGEHHAYEQPENDGEQEIDVLVAEKEFRCTAAHYHQAKEFVEMIGKTGQHYDMIVHGEGLIAHIIKKCTENWCNIMTDEYKGWIFKNALWGKTK